MSKHEDEDDLILKLVRTFQDVQLGTSRYRSIPHIPNETAQSHLFRIIDYMNPEIWDNSSTNAISKEVILTLLQCAARLYEGGVHAKEAVDLIESEDTRAILSLGIQDSLSQVIHQRCVESIRSNKSEATSAKNCSQQAGLFSAIRKNKARQLNHQGMIIEHISSLCRLHNAALQNTFDGPMIDEPFIFTNYITLSKTLNLREKSWLVTLLPDVFQWNTSDNTLVSLPSHDPTTISNELQGHITLGTYKDIQEAFEFIDSSIPPFLLTDGDVQHWLGKSTPKEINEMWNTCCNWRAQSQHSGSEFSIPTNKVLIPEKWIELLRKKAMAYRNMASVEAVASVLNAANTLHDQATCQKEESTSLSSSFESEDVRDYDKTLKQGLQLPSDDISDLDLNLVESDDDGECVFPLSPIACNDASNGKSVLTHMHNIDFTGKNIPDRATSAKDTQPAFTSTSSTDASTKIAGKDCHLWSKKFEPGDQASDYKTKMMLWTIHEESQEQ